MTEKKGKKTLFSIHEDLIQLDNLIEEIGGDVTDPAVDATITSWFNELMDNEGDKLAGYIAYIQQLDMEESRAREIAREWGIKASSREKRVKWLKTRIMDYAKRTNRTEIKTSSGYKLCIQKNGGKAPFELVEGFTVENIPDEFTKTTKSVDFEKIQSAIDAGNTPAFIKVKEVGFHVRIR